MYLHSLLALQLLVIETMLEFAIESWKNYFAAETKDQAFQFFFRNIIIYYNTFSKTLCQHYKSNLPAETVVAVAVVAAVG